MSYFTRVYFLGLDHRRFAEFIVSVNGNKMIGEAKAGRPPASKLIGQRIL